MPSQRLLIPSVLALAAGSSHGRAAPVPGRQIVVTEHLGVAWTRELISYPFEAPQGTCHRKSVAVHAPAGPVNCQLSDVVSWPGATDSVQSAKLSFLVDLAPLAENSYTVTYGPEPVGEGGNTTLTVTPGRDRVEITTERLGARLLLGERVYAEPAAPASVPCPVLAMRLDDGTWSGGGRMTGKTRITGYSAELVEAGPVFAETRVRYTYEGGNTLEVRVHLAADDSSILLDTNVKTDDRGSGWEMVVAPAEPALTWRMCTERKGTNPWAGMPKYDKISTWIDVPLAAAPAGTVTNLSPWSDWWNDATQVCIRLKRAGGAKEWRITRRHAGAWVTPKPLGQIAPFGEYTRKLIPLVRAGSGELYLRIDNAAGRRSWAVGTLPPLQPIPEEIRKQSRPHTRPMPGDTPTPTTEYPGQMYLARYEVLRHGRVGRHLDEVKDWVMDWKTRSDHPCLYMNRKQLLAVQRREPDAEQLAELRRIGGRQEKMRSSHRASHAIGAYLLTGDGEVAEAGNLVGMLDDLLGRLGVQDTWRTNGMMGAFYDAVMSGDLLTDEQRRLFRARFAYLGYRSADAATWSMERGYCSGNLNMSVANSTLLGILACTIPNHPMANEWVEPAKVMVEEMLETKVGHEGEWPESAAHYAHVSCSALLTFAIAARNAGLADFISDERMKRLQLFLAKQYSPPDPRHTEGRRMGRAAITPPVGRGTSGEDFSLHGFMARATAQSDPAYSRAMQWLWLRGQPRAVTGTHTLGWEFVVLDPTLPAETPEWGLDYFPRTGAIMRHGVGTPDEWYVYTIGESHYSTPGETGTTPLIFARGKPISSRFAYSYPDREEILLNRVLLARPRGDVSYRVEHYNHGNARRELAAVSDLPRQQYVVGSFTIDAPWRLDLAPPKELSQSNFRILPEWPHVDREGAPGVTWERQLLFVKDEHPAGPSYLVFRDTVTGGQPTMWQFWTFSEKVGTPEEAADRDAFLADAPGDAVIGARRLQDGRRYTALGQFGLDVDFYVAEPADTPRHTLRFGTKHPWGSLGNYKEYQDLLHLQRADDGAYFVVVYPRLPTDEAPAFATLGGKIVEVRGRFGADLCFLSAEPTTAAAGSAEFEGTVASVQDRTDGLGLSLGARGHIRYKQYGITAEQPAGLRVHGPRSLTVEFPVRHEGARATITAAGSWRLAQPTEGVTLEPDGKDGVTVSAASGTRTVPLVKM